MRVPSKIFINLNFLYDSWSLKHSAVFNFPDFNRLLIPRQEMTLLITAVLLILLAYDVTEGCPRRRRRSPPPCQRFDCQVSSWRSWSSCSQQCGTSGIKSRSRYKTQNAQCGGSCPYHFSESRPCNRDACRHGGTPWSRGCRCPAGWAGTCCENGNNVCNVARYCRCSNLEQCLPWSG